MEKTPCLTYLSCVSMVNKAKGLSQESYMKVCFSVCLAKIILLFSLFLLPFMGLTVLFDTIHEFHCTISVNFYLYLQHFQQKVFSFSKISGTQRNPWGKFAWTSTNSLGSTSYILFLYSTISEVKSPI